MQRGVLWPWWLSTAPVARTPCFAKPSFYQAHGTIGCTVWYAAWYGAIERTVQYAVWCHRVHSAGGQPMLGHMPEAGRAGDAYPLQYLVCRPRDNGGGRGTNAMWLLRPCRDGLVHGMLLT